MAIRDTTLVLFYFSLDVPTLTRPHVVLPYRRHISSLTELSTAEKRSLAEIISKLTKRYDNLFSTSFAYSMGIHQRPVPKTSDEPDEYDVAQLHFHFYPPLLRSSSVRKFLVGQVFCFLHWSILTMLIGLNLWGSHSAT